MYRSDPRLTFLLAVALTMCVVPDRAAAQVSGPGAPSSGVVRGTTVDPSAGVLPGVTVVATSADGRTLATAVTSATGEFRFDRLPAGSVNLSFHLDGFEESRKSVVIEASDRGDAKSAPGFVHRMELLVRAESVTVRGDPPPPPPPPKPVLVPVPEHDQVSVCGPARAESVVPSLGTIRSRRVDETKVLFATGDELLIDGGSLNGIEVGQNFVVRRRYPTALRYGRNLIVMGEHSSGLLQIVAVDEHEATAVVVYACDEMMRGDYLARFEPEPPRQPEPAGRPAFDRAAKILFADAGQPLGVTGRMMVLDRGSREDVKPGQRLTLFRRSRFGGGKPFVVGAAIVVAVRANSSTIRVEQATDVIFFGDGGDWAAPHHPPSRASVE